MAATILITTGVPGCGKTYVRAARFLVDNFLLNTSGVHYSNFPLNVDEICKEVSARSKPGLLGWLFRSRVLTPDDVKKRIKVIPAEVLVSWFREESGPWDYFKGVDLKYAHIAIDEIHNYLAPNKSLAYKAKWDEFLGEIRHRGCTFEGLTQNFNQVDPVFSGRAALRLVLTPGEDRRDPYFKILMSDWYELKAAFTGHYHKTVFEIEYRQNGARWVENNVRRFLITPDYYKFYYSFNASVSERAETVSSKQNLDSFSSFFGGAPGSDNLPVSPSETAPASVPASDADRAIEHEFQRRSRLGLLVWFISRNFFTLFWRLAVAVFLIWLFFFGGFNFFLQKWLETSKTIAAKNRGVSAPASKISYSVPESAASGRGSQPVSFVSGSGAGGQADKNCTLKEVEEKEKIKQIYFDGYKPAMFFEGKCWLRNGIKILKGHKFDDEPYKNLTVSEIDSVDRFYLLSDGRRVYMY